MCKMFVKCLSRSALKFSSKISKKGIFFSTMNPSLNRRINIPLHLKEIDFFSFPYTEQFRNGALSLSLIRGW